MLISSLVKPKKRGTDTKPANKQTPINTGKQRGRNRKNIFEQMELELKNLTENISFKTYKEAVKARLEAEEKYFGEYNVHSGQLK